MNGANINVLKIASHAKRASEPRTKPKIGIVGGIHGNEAVSTEIALYLADYLIKRHTEDVDLHQVSIIEGSEYCVQHTGSIILESWHAVVLHKIHILFQKFIFNLCRLMYLSLLLDYRAIV